MFKKAVQQFINQIDSGGELIPATSVYDSEKFKPLCLVCRRTGGPFWRKAKFSCTDFKLKQILVDETSLPTVLQNDLSFQFSESFEMKGFAKLNNKPYIAKKVCKTIQLKGANQVYIRVSDLTESLENRKVGRFWDLIKSSYSGDLCVVTEALLSVQPIIVKEVNKRGLEIYMTLASCPVSAEYKHSTERTLCIPEGAVLAYKVWDLTVTNDGMLCLSKKKSQPKSWICMDGTDVKGEGFQIFHKLQCLDNGLKQHLLDLVCQIVEDSELHSILSDMLSDACAGIDYKLSELNKLDKNRRTCGENLLAIWSEDQLKNAVEDKLLQAVSFLLAALEDLPPATVRLLIQSLKMQILTQQLDLVTSILKDLEPSQVNQVLNVETQGFTEDAFGITAEMLNESGLHLERDSVQKENKLNLCELSIALYYLYALSSH